LFVPTPHDRRRLYWQFFRPEDHEGQSQRIDINYEIEGNGPWLTMSHSLACNLNMWDPQMPALTKKFRVLRYDTRGHGQSSAPAGEYTLEQLADDVKGLLDALKIKQTHWAGLSMGGMIGQTFALKYPGLFQSMVLADTTSRRPPDAAKRANASSSRRNGRVGRRHARPLVHRAPNAPRT
jgi:pimeloyl-ACP methyl ester carboxylesterase